MRTKRDKVDSVFSRLVRERASWKCERCGLDCTDNPGGLDCSHLWGRARKSVRWCPDNAVAHCKACHFYLGQHPHEFGEWITEHLGDKLDGVRSRAGQPLRVSRVYKEEIYRRLKFSYDEMMEKRRAGEMGRIEFPDPYEGGPE